MPMQKSLLKKRDMRQYGLKSGCLSGKSDKMASIVPEWSKLLFQYESYHNDR